MFSMAPGKVSKQQRVRLGLGAGRAYQRVLPWTGAKTWRGPGWGAEEGPARDYRLPGQTWQSVTGTVVPSSPGGPGIHRNGNLQEEKRVAKKADEGAEDSPFPE